MDVATNISLFQVQQTSLGQFVLPWCLACKIHCFYKQGDQILTMYPICSVRKGCKSIPLKNVKRRLGRTHSRHLTSILSQEHAWSVHGTSMDGAGMWGYRFVFANYVTDIQAISPSTALNQSKELNSSCTILENIQYQPDRTVICVLSIAGIIIK